MSKFKIGDVVIRTKGTSFNTPFGIHKAGWVGTVQYISEDFGEVLEFYGGHKGYADKYELYKPEPKCKCLCAEDAKIILEAQGYTISEPKTGKVYVSEPLKGGEIMYTSHKLNTKLYRTLAVLDWKQGEGL